MAEFNPTIESTNVFSSSPRQAITDNTQAVVTNMETKSMSEGFNILNKGIDLFQSVTAKKKAAEAEEAKNKDLVRFQGSLVEIENNRSLGNISLSKAEILRRNAKQDFDVAHPELLEDSTRVFKNVSGKFSDAFTPEEAAMNALEQKFIVSGEMPIDTTPASFRSLFSSWQKKEAITANLSREQQQLSFMQAGVTLESSQLSLEKAKVARAENEAALNLVTLETNDYQTKTNDIVTTALAGGPNARALALNKMAELTANTEFRINAQAGGGGEAKAAFAISSMNKISKATTDFLSGATNKQVYENHVANVIALNQVDLLKNVDELPQTTAIMRLMPAVTDVAFFKSNVAPNYIEYVSQNSTETPEGSTSIKDRFSKVANVMVDQAAPYLKDLQTFTSDWSKGRYKGDEEGDKELKKQVENTLVGVDAYQNLIQNPKDLNSMNKLFSDPAFGRLIGTGDINPEAIDAAGDVWKSQYRDKVVPAIIQEWENKITPPSITNVKNPKTKRIEQVSRPSQNLKDLLTPVYGPAGVEFIPTGDITGFSQAELDHLINTQLKPLATMMNQLSRQGAHLAGNFDYEKQFNNNFEKFFEVSE